MSDQMRIPCVIMRAGTSKGIFIKENDLPKDQALRDKTILAIFGSPDVRQIDHHAEIDDECDDAHDAEFHDLFDELAHGALLHV